MVVYSSSPLLPGCQMVSVTMSSSQAFWQVMSPMLELSVQNLPSSVILSWDTRGQSLQSGEGIRKFPRQSEDIKLNRLNKVDDATAKTEITD